MNSELAIFLAIFFLIFNAFFVLAEISLIAARRSAIEAKAIKGSARAKTVVKSFDNMPILITGAQLGITLCSLALGALSEPAIAHGLSNFFNTYDISPEISSLISIVIAIIIVTLLHIIIGEIIPKNISLSSPNRYAIIFIPPLVYLTKLVNPLVIALNNFTQLMFKIFKVNASSERISTFTTDELAGLVTESINEGLIDKEDKRLLNSALKFDKRTIKSVLIPIEKFATIDDQTTPEELETIVGKTGYSRFPIKDKEDSYIGYIHIKDILDIKYTNRTKVIPKSIIRSMIAVYTSQSIRSVLKTMQKSGSHIALVKNNKEKIIGIVTLQDVLEEIVD